MKRVLTLTAAAACLTLAGCGQTYTFEANPTGDTSEGWKGNPAGIECFVIEADASSGDGSDKQLGEFCKVAKPSKEAERQMREEGDGE